MQTEKCGAPRFTENSVCMSGTLEDIFLPCRIFFLLLCSLCQFSHNPCTLSLDTSILITRSLDPLLPLKWIATSYVIYFSVNLGHDLKHYIISFMPYPLLNMDWVRIGMDILIHLRLCCTPRCCGILDRRLVSVLSCHHHKI